jgi:hypothetical protein
VICARLIRGLQDLRELAKYESKMFCGSTSSLTGMLSQVYFLISGNRPPDTSSLSGPFRHMVRVSLRFPVESAHRAAPEAGGFHIRPANAGLCRFELQGRGLRN